VAGFYTRGLRKVKTAIIDMNVSFCMQAKEIKYGYKWFLEFYQAGTPLFSSCNFSLQFTVKLFFAVA